MPGRKTKARQERQADTDVGRRQTECEIQRGESVDADGVPPEEPVVASNITAEGPLKLQFRHSINWRTGAKPIPASELNARLEELSKELRGIGQEEEIDHESFDRVAQELASSCLLSHKEPGVRAWVAACLVDILRLYAPEAPYSPVLLKEIFVLFIEHIIPTLGDYENAYHLQHLYVSNSLAQVKSIVLVTDVAHSDKLVSSLFSTAFDLVAGASSTSRGTLPSSNGSRTQSRSQQRIEKEPLQSPQPQSLSKTAEFDLLAMLTILVDESPSLASGAVDAIVAQFLRVDPDVVRRSSHNTNAAKHKATSGDKSQSTLLLKQLPPSYNMAKTICNTCPDRLARAMSQYFNDVVVGASISSTGMSAAGVRATNRRITEEYEAEQLGSPVDRIGEPSEDDLRNLHRVHQLLRELWRACPTVLQNVIPQLEAELSAENVHLRLLATETFGDLIAGISAAGLPPPPTLDPTAFPYPSVTQDTARDVTSSSLTTANVLTKPCSPQPFSHAHPQAYQSFLGRCHDRSASIRAAWTTGIGRILATSAGGVGLSPHEEQRLTGDLAKVLSDSDEKVRLAGVEAIGSFSLATVVSRLGSNQEQGDKVSVMATLIDRLRDRKHAVRTAAMTICGRLWGCAVGELLSGNDLVTAILGRLPSTILETYFTNDPDIHHLLDQVMYEQLLPLNFPPIKSKLAQQIASSQEAAQEQSEGQHSGSMLPNDIYEVDVDCTRTERILMLVANLSDKAKKVFFALQKRQNMLSQVMTIFLHRCEDYNGGVMDKDSKVTKAHMTRLIDNLAKNSPDPTKMAEYLWKFAKIHDRRAYQLIRFCMAPESDYRTVVKAIREFSRRMDQSAHVSAEMLSSMLALLYRVSLLVYNRSHVPNILTFSRTFESRVAIAAQEMLREISTVSPEVLKAQIKGICASLQDEAPGADTTRTSSSADNLRICASFATRFPEEIPSTSKFIEAMLAYCLHGPSPHCAKSAVTILLSSDDGRNLRATEIIEKSLDNFRYGAPGFVPRMAALAQVTLLAPVQADAAIKAISDLAIEDILMHESSVTSPETAHEWRSEPDADEEAKCWAVKFLVNRLRSYCGAGDLAEISQPVYDLLSKILQMTVSDNEDVSEDIAIIGSASRLDRPRLRLLAGRLCLKLAQKKHTDALISTTIFNQLAILTRDPLYQVRSGFWRRLQKYLSASRLPVRFFTLPFCYALDTSTTLHYEVASWIRSRQQILVHARGEDETSTARIPQVDRKSSGMVMEFVFVRFISILARFMNDKDQVDGLCQSARFILFYLNNVASEDNSSLILHLAQRVKQCHDAIDSSPVMDKCLHRLSDLAQLVIRHFEEAHHWNIETLPGKASLPRSLYADIKDHAVAVEIAERDFLPDAVKEQVPSIVRDSIRNARTHGKKRRGMDTQNVPNRKEDDIRSAKRVRVDATPAAGVDNGVTLPESKMSRSKPKSNGEIKSKRSSKGDNSKDSSTREGADRRRSTRNKPGSTTYRDRNDSEDDEEMAGGVLRWKYTSHDEADMKADDDDDDPESEDKDHDDMDDGDDNSQQIFDGRDDTLKSNGKLQAKISGKNARENNKRKMSGEPRAAENIHSPKKSSSTRHGDGDERIASDLVDPVDETIQSSQNEEVSGAPSSSTLEPESSQKSSTKANGNADAKSSSSKVTKQDKVVTPRKGRKGSTKAGAPSSRKSSRQLDASISNNSVQAKRTRARR